MLELDEAKESFARVEDAGERIADENGIRGRRRRRDPLRSLEIEEGESRRGGRKNVEKIEGRSVETVERESSERGKAREEWGRKRGTGTFVVVFESRLRDRDVVELADGE
jgi:hypothetical protein